MGTDVCATAGVHRIQSWSRALAIHSAPCCTRVSDAMKRIRCFRFTQPLSSKAASAMRAGCIDSLYGGFVLPVEQPATGAGASQKRRGRAFRNIASGTMAFLRWSAVLPPPSPALRAFAQRIMPIPHARKAVPNTKQVSCLSPLSRPSLMAAPPRSPVICGAAS
jgi:hypothetical protein